MSDSARHRCRLTAVTLFPRGGLHEHSRMRVVASSWTVYLVRCRDRSLYTGITTDLDRRLASHNAGTASRYTRSRLPVRLVHHEPAPSRSAALKREAAIKRLSRSKKLDLVGKRTGAGPRPGRRS